MAPQLSNAFLRDLGIEDHRGTTTRKRKFSGQPRNGNNRTPMRDFKRPRRQGSLTSQQQARTQDGRNGSSHVRSHKEQSDLRDPGNQPPRKPASNPKSSSSHGLQLPWSSDDSIHESDFDSEPEPPGRRNKKATILAEAQAKAPARPKSARKVPHKLDLPWSDDDSIHTSDMDSDPEPPVSKKQNKQEKVVGGYDAAKPRLSARQRAELEEEDLAIARLEKKLGIKGNKKSRSSEKDGLDDLLKEIDTSLMDEEDLGKNGHLGDQNEDEAWLKQKRAKALGKANDAADKDNDNEESQDELDMQGISESNASSSTDEFVGFSDEGDSHDDVMDELGESRSHAVESTESEKPAARQRENPYVPPTTGRIAENASAASTNGTYVPPHLRGKVATEDTARLQRQVKSLVNKVTQATLVPCLNDLDKIYRSNPRQLVTEAAVDQLLAASSERAKLVDAFTVDVAGFCAAIYKLIGIDFAAHLVRRSYEKFMDYFNNPVADIASEAPTDGEEAVRNKETSNLISLVSALYSLEVVGPRLVYDYIRFLLQPDIFSERNADLLMRVIQVCGPKLRKDDPVALKSISHMVRPAVDKIGASNLSFRARFVIDNIADLVNNRPKAVHRYAISSERIVSMKKTLGAVKVARGGSHEPLNLGFDDLENASSVGMWWKTGARWDGHGTTANVGASNHAISKAVTTTYSNDDDAMEPDVDLHALATAQGMNTMLRRSIFAAIVTGVDADDGARRVAGLRLNARRLREVAPVVCQCVGSERNYNIYYALLARRFCAAGHQMQYAFQTALWHVFRRLGEPLFDDYDYHGSDDDDEALADRWDEGHDDDMEAVWDEHRVANTARLFGVLIGDGLLPLRCLRAVNLLRLGKRGGGNKKSISNKSKELVKLIFVAVLLPLPEKSFTVRRKLRAMDDAGEDVLARVFGAPGITRRATKKLKKHKAKKALLPVGRGAGSTGVEINFDDDTDDDEDDVGGDGDDARGTNDVDDDQDPVFVAGVLKALDWASVFKDADDSDLKVLRWGIKVARRCLGVD